MCMCYFPCMFPFRVVALVMDPQDSEVVVMTSSLSGDPTVVVRPIRNSQAIRVIVNVYIILVPWEHAGC